MQHPQWIGSVITLRNDVLQVDVAPQIGRVCGLSRHGGENWLWMNPGAVPVTEPWPSIGGDKFWPTAQPLWPQVHGTDGPEAVFDKLPWIVVAQGERFVELRSGLSHPLGLIVTRRVELAAAGARVQQLWTLERVAACEFPVCVWTISSCRLGDYILIDADRRSGRGGERRYHTFGASYPVPTAGSVGYSAHRLAWPPGGSAKLGTYGEWVALVRGTEAFVQRAALADAGCYLEESSMQAWVAPEAGFCEIETSSPYWNLRVGERRDWAVSWEVLDVPAGKLARQAEICAGRT